MIPQTDFSSSIELLTNGNVRYTSAYGSYEFERMPLQKLEGSALAEARDRLELSISSAAPSKETTRADQIAFFKRSYMAGSLEGSPKVRDAWRDVSGQADKAIGKFMDGTMSGDELASTFQTLAHEMFESTARAGYPIPFVESDMEQACTEAMYDTFREKILSTAVQRNNEQGRQYVTGELCPQRTWKYYNADYYYKSEDAIDAVTRGMDGFVQDRGWEWTVPDYRGKGLNMYCNFNTALFNSFCLDERRMVDPDMVPPEGFEWFYQTGGNPRGPHVQMLSQTTTYPDGTEVTIHYPQPDKFDPENPFTATTWAAYTDKEGNRHVISRDVIFKGDKGDLFNVGDLLRFDAGEESEGLNAFLSNLQLYPKNYFHWNSGPFSCRA